MLRVLLLRSLLVTLVEMTYHPVRNFLGLLVLYSIIIFGIFSLQFRSDSSILQKFGSLHLRLSNTSTQNKPEHMEYTLKNSFQVSSNGIVLFANDSTPLLLQNSQGESIPLVLQDWKETSLSSFTLLFSENVSLDFSSDGNSFDFHALLPTQESSIYIPYKTTDTYSVTDMQQNKIIFESKNETFSLQANNINEKTIILSSASGAIAQVTFHEKITRFSFSSVIDREKVSATSLALLSTQMRAKLVADYPSIQPNSLNENFVAAYVAELGSKGNYNDGRTNIPASFINGTKRTYFTAPYFDTLVRMNQTLDTENKNISYSMQYSIDRGILDVFELDAFPTFLLRQKSSDIASILSLPASLEVFEPTVSQATGILTAHTSLFAIQPASAALLEPVLERCIKVIEASCILTETSLSLVTDGVALDNTLAVKTGKALLDYGKIKSQADLQASGTLLIVSVLQNKAALDTSTMATIYPYVVDDNLYYPHSNILAYENGNPVWAWNIATSLKYSKVANGTIIIDMEFPVGEIHHMIITGIEPFSSIEIYGLPYNSDPRFEIYNAPGYVYIAETKTLLLKYRQRDSVERLRLFYN